MKSVLQGKKLLVVEDDPGICELLESYLSNGGALVEVVKTGDGAADAIQKVQPDLILLDVVLPGKDGFAVLESFRAAGGKVPVIMLTDQSTVDDKVKGLTTGADDYVTKPFSTRELGARIESIFRRVGQEVKTDPVVISLGPLTLHLAERELKHDAGGVLQLTKTEFDLFAYLAVRLSQVIAHSSLLEEVMGYRGDIETKALVMHIANIRRKLLHSEVENVKIETVAGVGYKLVVVD